MGVRHQNPKPPPVEGRKTAGGEGATMRLLPPTPRDTLAPASCLPRPGAGVWEEAHLSEHHANKLINMQHPIVWPCLHPPICSGPGPWG